MDITTVRDPINEVSHKLEILLTVLLRSEKGME